VISKTQYFGATAYPLANLATEAYLLETVPAGCCILYLWQNKQTVVIGRNQNSWKECKVRELEEDGGYLVRRLSGGGAVFHDLGNLNFTFLVRQEDYDVDRQLEVILRAVRILGIAAEKSGRNDLTIDGRKFSGNAFTPGRTLLPSRNPAPARGYTELEPVSECLGEKLRSKGVDSVRAGLSTWWIMIRSDRGVDEEKLIAAFSEVYGKARKNRGGNVRPGKNRRTSSPIFLLGMELRFQNSFYF
jgi:lipoate-protein ligase A